MHVNAPQVWAPRRAMTRAMTLALAAMSMSLMLSASTSPPEPQREAQREPPTAPVTVQSISADVTLTQGLLTQAGKPLGAPVPPARYRWQRKKNGRYWKTTMTVVSGIRPPMRLLSGVTKEVAPTVVRIEDAGDGSAPRYYDQRDREVRQPRAADAARSAASLPDIGLALPATNSQPDGARMPRTIDDSVPRSLAVVRSDGKNRREQLLRRFGPVISQVRGLDRFLSTVEDGSVEILVDPQIDVIREWNLIRKGELEARGSALYEGADNDLLLRRNSRVERKLPNGNGSRMTTEVDLTNVHFESR